MATEPDLQIPEEGRVVEDPYQSVSRRGFLTWLTVGWIAFSAALATLGAAFQRFLFPNVLREPPQQFKAGFPSTYQEGMVDTRYKDQHGVWIVRGYDNATGQTGIYALSTVCTHLGCTPTWLEGEQKYKCPCHGSGFRMNGVNFEGPAPRPLERYRIVLADDGQILIDKSRKYQFEKGQWIDAEALLTV